MVEAGGVVPQWGLTPRKLLILRRAYDAKNAVFATPYYVELTWDSNEPIQAEGVLHTLHFLVPCPA
jgi:hypothetical protein